MAILHAMLGNAAVAAVLAVLALAAGRFCRSPAVRHLLWVLVLLKLVTPPLFHVPLVVLPASWAAPPTEPSRLGGFVLQPLPSAADQHPSPAEGPERAPTWWGRSWVAVAGHGVPAVWAAGAA